MLAAIANCKDRHFVQEACYKILLQAESLI